ncbi:MAG: hypothetical protein HY812_04775 [Planctomycetes bacterium]|nr:hypothetical protein [Planctomycetota bacterium]
MTQAHWSHPLLAALAAVLVLWTSVDGEFIYDDRSYVQKNPSVQGTRGIFDEASPPDREDLGLYRPLTILTYRWTYQLRGLDPFAFHLLNVLLHGVVSALVVLVALSLGAGSSAALLAGLLFAVHPVHVESVAWIVGRAELLAAAFALLALLAHGRPGDRRSLPRLLLAALLYGMAAISKETALPLPALFFFLDLGARGALPARRAVLRLAPAALVCGLVVLLRWRVLGRFSPDVGADPFLGALTAGDRPGIALAVLGRTIRTLLLPWKLSIYYDPRQFVGFLPLAAGAALALGLAFLLWLLRRRGRGAALGGLLLFLVAMLPFLHLVPIGAIFADRFLYLPSSGFLIAGAALVLPARSSVRPWRALLALLLVAACSTQTLRRAPVFQNGVVLWEDAVAADPQAAFALFQLGGIYHDAEMFEYQSESRRGAVYYFSESLRVAPDNPWAADAHLKLGEYAAGKVGDPARAARHYREALQRAPRCVEAMLDLAALWPSGHVAREEARRLLQAALALAPGDTQREAARQLLAELDAAGREPP